MPATPRRRPATRKGRPVLTREIIAAKALEMAGAQGFPALTMRALAAELDVTVRALYNYVEDRGEVVSLAVDLMLTSWTPPPLDPAAWETSVAGYAGSLRALYRRWPRALLVSLDEDTPPASVHPNRLLNLDRFLRLLRDVGLDLPAALAAHRHLSLLVLSFALVVDGPAGRAGDDRNPLVPDAWLTAHADLDIPVLREAAALPLPTPDEQFDELVSAVVDRIRGGLRAC
ncbi:MULTISPECIES: TetR/AcrR family transcriptional regulator [Streptomyces]|uniref:TetR/AcrR family transcriptional regulator n=1 Tax=Streptomyces TaxID=1883 RepID=UPI0002419EAD|nr:MULTISPECIES: TetR/AcrR family transcriptional regulator [Streptomyces]EHM29287.1 TetR family transcriptional regulator [Streptomyces sp. W007]OKI51589.1 TetR family transcriptional regulator [Streptomyces sp. CB00072]WSU72012.1 TetR/AcrR family transcriptional regulator [Streptomyces anulatus]WTD08300.1 TetR/AcrR family transcriptional regulator [Streptomyces anulatus]WTD29618.1 TetR/AcrR family transcriptional regulator [Streptomyces anulatus]